MGYCGKVFVVRERGLAAVSRGGVDYEKLPAVTHINIFQNA